MADIAWCTSFLISSIFLVSLQAYLRTVLRIVATAAAFSWFFVLARIQEAGGASALVAVLVLNLLLAAGVVAFGVDCAAVSLHCLLFFQRIFLVRVLCVEDVLVGVSVVCTNARVICLVASLSDKDIDRVSRWAGAAPCTLGTDWVLVRCVVRTLRTDGVMLSGVENVLAMVGSWWMACSVSSTSCCISSLPWAPLMSLIAFAQSVIAFMILSAWVMVGLVMLFVAEVYCVRDSFTFGCFYVASVRVIMFGGS
jgi:hypothetical protein